MTEVAHQISEEYKRYSGKVDKGAPEVGATIGALKAQADLINAFWLALGHEAGARATRSGVENTWQIVSDLIAGRPKGWKKADEYKYRMAMEEGMEVWNRTQGFRGQNGKAWKG